MLVATFGPSTAWVGKTITFENEQFILEGHGVILAAGIMEYDRQGHLAWVSPEMRDWVIVRAAPPATQVAPRRAKKSRPQRPAKGELLDVLLPAGDTVEVVGESHYQAALEAIVGGKTEDVCQVEKWAHVLAEPDNPYDRNAVMVLIDGQKVGYLSRDDAGRYLPYLVKLRDKYHSRGVCRANIGGGWRRVHEGRRGVPVVEEGSFGVKLGLACPEFLRGKYKLPVLSPEELEAGPT